MDKKEKQALAIEIFGKYPNKSTVFVTPDGQCFFEENRAMLIAKKEEIETVNRLDIMGIETPKKADEPKMESKAKIALILNSTAEELAELEKDETRVTVIKAIDERKSVLALETKSENK